MSKRINFRTDSTLGNLPPERQAMIAGWVENCEEGDRYELAREQLAADGITVSRSAVFSWYRSYSLQRDLEAADSLAADVTQVLKDMNIGLTAQQLDEAGQIVFTKTALVNQDAEGFQKIQYLKLAKDSARAKADLEERKLALSERRVRVMELKLEQIKGALTDDSLSEDERARKMKAVFGISA